MKSSASRLWRRGLGLLAAAALHVGLVGCQAPTTPPASSTVGSTATTTTGNDQPAAPLEFGTWEERSAALRDPNGRLMIVAHRGVWSETAPENSIAALEEAYALGVDMVELDIYTTADNELVLSHDESLTRMTNVSAAWMDGTLTGDKISYTVGGLTLEQIKSLRLKAGEGGANAPLTEYPMLTFGEALDYCRDKMYIMLDIKDGNRTRVYQEITAHDAWEYISVNLGGADLAAYDGNLAAHKALYGGAPARVWGLGRDTMDEVVTALKAKLVPQLYEMPWCMSIFTPTLTWESVVDKTYDLEQLLDPRLKEAVAGKTRLQAMTLIDWGRRMGEEYDCEEMWGKLIDAGFTVLMTDRAADLCAYRKQRFGVGY